MFKRYPSWSRI